jgi:class 3 adenylate cyclase
MSFLGLKSPRLNDIGLKIFGLSLGVIFLGVAVSKSTHIQRFEAASWVRVQFEARNILGRGPSFDSRIKVIWFGDHFIKMFGSYNRFTAEYWSALFEKIAEKKPQAIIVDALMSAPETQKGWEWANLPFKKAHSLSNNVKVFSGIAFKSEGKRGKESIDFSDTLSIPEAITNARGGSHKSFKTENSDDRTTAIYSSKYWEDVVIPKGHIQYSNDTSRVFPTVRVQDLGIVPHLGIGSVSGWKMEPDGAKIDGTPIPSSNFGMLVNYIHPKKYFQSQKSGLTIFADIFDKKPVDWISEGDYVFIAPMMWTGHTDKIWTPFGVEDGSLAVVSVLNSALKKEFITEPLGQTTPVILVGLSLVLLVLTTPITISGYLVLGFVGLWVVLGALLFSYFGIFIPAAFPCTVGLVSASFLFLRKVQIEEMAVQSIKLTLSGKISDRDMDLATNRKFSLQLDAREHVITVVFVDIVGYSAMAEELSPNQAFEDLKFLLSEMREIIHKYNGFVDKTLGDGLLAYFGYSLVGGRSAESHALNAVKAALEIQRTSIRRVALQANERIYPMRIGINTTSCLIGNLGTDTQIDVTVVGHGVNLAKRLEGAAKPYHILVGSLTWELVSSDLPDIKSTKKQVRLKHHNDFLSAIEIFPSDVSESELSKALLLGSEVMKRRRKSARHDYSAAGSIRGIIQGEKVTLINFSLGGLSTRINKTALKGDHIWLELVSSHLSISDDLAKVAPQGIECIIQWVVSEPNGWIIGLSYESLSMDQRQALYNIFIQEIATLKSPS